MVDPVSLTLGALAEVLLGRTADELCPARHALSAVSVRRPLAYRPTARRGFWGMMTTSRPYHLKGSIEARKEIAALPGATRQSGGISCDCQNSRGVNTRISKCLSIYAPLEGGVSCEPVSETTFREPE